MSDSNRMFSQSPCEIAGWRVDGLVELTKTGEAWRSESTDPQIFMRRQNGSALRKGWFAIKITRLEKADCLPRKIYFQIDGWFDESACAFFPGDGLDHQLLARFNQDLKSLRVDPAERRGIISNFIVDLIPLTPVQALERLAAKAWAVLRRNPRDFLSIGLRFARRLARDPFICLSLTADEERASYKVWHRKFGQPSATTAKKLRSAARRLTRTGPKFSIVIPTFEVSPKIFEETLNSVLNQSYTKFEVCIADDASGNQEEVAEIAAQKKKYDHRVKFVALRERRHISGATNAAFKLATGEWTVMLDHDDLLDEHALAFLAHEAVKYPEARVIYTDEDKIDKKGRRYDPHFKPDWCYDQFLSQNYLNHLSAVETRLVKQVGGWRAGYEGSQDYDLLLRIIERIEPNQIRHIPYVLYHWRATAGSVALAANNKNYPWRAGKRALEEHLRRTGVKARVLPTERTPYYRIVRAIKSDPRLSIIIPTRNNGRLLDRCVDAVRELGGWRNHEIVIIDNRTTDEYSLQLYDALAARGDVKVLRYDKRFNYSAINNFGVKRSDGELLLFLNDDAIGRSKGWIRELVSHAVRPEVGAVGGKLYYEDGRIQHAGVVLGIGGVAGHAHKYRAPVNTGYFGRLDITQNFSAVTGACLMTSRDDFLTAGMFEEESLQVAFNDVDYCLKLVEKGLKIVWHPHAEAWHLESVSRGADDTPEKADRFNREIDYMLRKWSDRLFSDPCYSPNLTLKREDFSIASKPRRASLDSMAEALLQAAESGTADGATAPMRAAMMEAS